MTEHWLLIVDDDPDITALIAMAAARCGCRARTAQTLADALAIATADETPSAVLLDLYLEDADPADVCTVMRQHVGQDAWIAVMTADPSITQASLPGADALFHKPFDVDSLMHQLLDRLPGCRG